MMRARSLAIWKALTSVIGPDEILLIVGLVLVTVALWPLAVRWTDSGLPALFVPGAIVLYVALPARAPFVVKPSVPEKPVRRVA